MFSRDRSALPWKTHQAGFYPKVPTFSSAKKKVTKEEYFLPFPKAQGIAISQTSIPKPLFKRIHLVLAATSHSHITIPDGASPASFP